MESSSEGRCGEIASDLSIIFVTVAQLIFFRYFYEYIAWYTRAPDGSITRLSLLTDDYFTWLPFPTIASIIVVLATIVMIVYNRHWFRQTGWIVFNILGITMVVSLLAIFPFDFSVIPNAAAADAVPKVLTGFLIFMAAFYGISALVLIVRSRRHKT